MPNIRFNYLYRDGGNFKQFGTIVLSNPTELTIQETQLFISQKLIDALYFYAHEWGIPALYPTDFDPLTDPIWHEFVSADFTAEKPTSATSMKGILML